MDRRTLLKLTALSGGGIAAVLHGASPNQPEGPFHPTKLDYDLRRLRSSGPMAQGQQILISGQVLHSDTKQGIDNAVIEIWQADSNGKYAHPLDPQAIALDPHFQYTGRAITNRQGVYQFYSIKPGSYPADEQWTRPPHIHLTIRRLGFRDLTTQLYFAGEDLNQKDHLFMSVPAALRPQLLVTLQGAEGQLQRGTFIIELDPIK